MTYKQTLHYMYSQLPMFHRIGSVAYKADLNNTIALCKLLGNPENKFKSIHVTGTNGKGSTSHMLAAILQAAGFKTGLYTSPHLKDFRERIRINGKMMPKQKVVDFIEKYKQDFERIKPSFFEMTVGMAFDFFSNEKVDIAVIEVGLGGRLDSTNVITPLVSVITNISHDHQNLLGDTLKKIATEKAGIIKKNIPVVIGETQKEVIDIFVRKANETQSKIFFADDWYKFKNVNQKNIKSKLVLSADVYRKTMPVFKKLECELSGTYQQKNIATVLMTIDILNREGDRITNDHIKKGISKVTTLTGLKGRWQIISKKPLIITDTGHNEAGIKEVMKQIKLTPHKNLHIILGMVNDKDVSSFLKLLPKKAAYYFCKPNIPRGLNAIELQQVAHKFKLKGEYFKSVTAALYTAKKCCSKGDLIFVGGSTFVTAEII